MKVATLYGLALASLLLVLVLLSEGFLLRERSTLHIVAWSYAASAFFEIEILLVGATALLRALAAPKLDTRWSRAAWRMVRRGIVVCGLGALISIAMLALY